MWSGRKNRNKEHPRSGMRGACIKKILWPCMRFRNSMPAGFLLPICWRGSIWPGPACEQGAGVCLPLAFSIQPGQYSNKPVWELACQLCIQIHEGVHVSHGNMTVTCLGIIGFSVNVATFHQIHDISLQ